jgi:predicted  nucleic acid-binding Zn-ribbon protein
MDLGTGAAIVALVSTATLGWLRIRTRLQLLQLKEKVANMHKLQERFSQLEIEKNRISAEKGRLEFDFEMMGHRHDALKEHLGDMVTKIEALEARDRDMVTATRLLEDQIARLTRENENLSENVKDLQSRVISLKDFIELKHKRQ